MPPIESYPDAGNSPVQTPPPEQRRLKRISLPLPVRVEVRVDANVSWHEVTRLSDISAFGAGFVLKRPIKRGRMVLMTIPMPRQLRCYDYSEPQYRIWGVVRTCLQTSTDVRKPEYSIGVAFTGKKPPVGYLEHPARLYDITRRHEDDKGLWELVPADLMMDDHHLPKEVRKQTRLFIPEPLRIEKLNEGGDVIASENTVTENISLGGAAIFTSLDVAEGEFLRVTSDRLSITILTVVRTSRTGPDGIRRLHLEFVDRFFPLEGIE